MQGPAQTDRPDILAELSASATCARQQGANLLVCPEMYLTGYAIGPGPISALAEPRDGPLMDKVRIIARDAGIAILTGFPERDGSAIYNTAVLIGADGSEIAHYRKTHLFGDVDCTQFAAGPTPPPVVDFAGLKVGLLICYDVEFPENVRGLALRGADLVLVPTALMRPAEIVAETVVVARAFENQVFLAYVNRCDHEAAFDYCGLSCIVGPDGRVLARAGSEAEMIFADIDPTALKQIRGETSHLADRRVALYATLTEDPKSPKDNPRMTHADDTDDTLTMLSPDFPFSYDRYLTHPAGLGHVPDARLGTEVAVIGAGMAGIVAAYELMKLGLRPVIYEAVRIGGRLRSEPVPGVDDMVVELGGMRFPPTGRAFFHYLNKAGAETTGFPNPLSDATPSTMIELGGEKHYARTAADLPPIFAEVGEAWTQALEDGAFLSQMQDALRARDTNAIKKLWNDLVPDLDGQSFYGFLARSDAFARRDFRHLEVFGQVGFGSGGWDTDFPNSMLEILRIVYTGADDDHQLVKGGVEQVPNSIWRHAPDQMAHWPTGTTLSSLHNGATLGEVRKIRRADDGGIAITDRWGNARHFAAAVVTCQSWLLSTTIDCDETLFDQTMWMAMERTHYMQSSKTFVIVDRPFWKETDRITGRDRLSMTLSDRKTRGTYLLDFGDDRPGAICLSYTWNDDAMKWVTLPIDERVDLMIDSIEKIYPGLDIRSHIIGDPITVSWENDRYFMGAFKGNLPGHYRYQRRLFSHFMQDDMPERRRGLFLAGDSVSWTAGWAEGAVTTALNAVWGVQKHFGGASAPDNPGPGDLWQDLQPLDLEAD
ncbi:FAD-dependent oxidoreductase [Maribius pontilimi]|uniref:FAD-dependent oxidoreductase n=1 Tax=Palleronia pontilimi TaxID=1964209 RepID=A0A934IKG2_9RHOB|nr:FAD-dependent oxidoreductase [Palleronia pontilimi]MBJ3764593.1 FAD-dependent oxidoreductase [Palleronia pontilimi]